MQAICFPPFRLEVANGQLWRGNEAIALRPKTFALLCYLAERPRQLITKDQLLNAVWPGTFVSDTVLKASVNELRRILEDDAQQPRFIETVHRRGYRFVGELIGPQRAERSRAETQQAEDVPGAVMVGRESERCELEKLWHEALGAWRRVVFISGEAGIGKTTLVEEFLRGLGVEGLGVRGGDGGDPLTPFLVARGQCVAQFGEAEAFLPVLEALGRLCRQPDGPRVVDLLRQHAPDWLLQLPGVINADEREAVRRQTAPGSPKRMLRLLVEVLEALTAERPFILVLEDLHWSDHATLDLIVRLAMRTDPARLLLLGTYRPVEAIVRDHPLPAVARELQLRGRCVELALAFLDRDAVRAYLTERCAAASIAPGLTAWLHRRTDGNPLFLVSVVDALLGNDLLKMDGEVLALQTGFEKLSVPESIGHMIEQQIDRLQPNQQRVLEGAAVVGVDFSAAAVAAAVDGNLVEVDELCNAWARRGQFLRALGAVAWPDGTVSARFAFIHTLYREVIYQRIAPARRALLHQRVGERLEAVFGPRAEPAELAEHFEQGGDARRAVHALQRVLGRAIRRGAQREVIATARRAIALLEQVPDTPERTRELLAFHLASGAALVSTNGFPHREVAEAFSAAAALSERIDATPSRFMALVGLWGYRLAHAQFADAHALAERLIELAQAMPLPIFMLVAHTATGTTNFFLGNLAAARLQLETALAAGEEQPAEVRPDFRCVALIYLANTLLLLGYPDQARERDRQALARARAARDPFDRTFIVQLSAQFRSCIRDEAAIPALSEEAAAVADEQQFPLSLPHALLGKGWCRAAAGDLEGGVVQMQQAIDELRSLGSERNLPVHLAILAETQIRARRYSNAQASIRDALAQAETGGEHTYDAELHRLQGECLLAAAADSALARRPRKGRSAAGAPRLASRAEAERCFQHALQVARAQGARWWELRAATSLGRLWLERHAAAEVRALLTPLLETFTEGLDTPDLREARALYDRVTPA